MKVSKQIVAHNLPDFIDAVLEATQAGWEVDASAPPILIGFTFTCYMLRDESIVDPTKPSRAEILAKARAAKALKAAGASETTSEGVAP